MAVDAAAEKAGSEAPGDEVLHAGYVLLETILRVTTIISPTSLLRRHLDKNSTLGLSWLVAMGDQNQVST